MSERRDLPEPSTLPAPTRPIGTIGQQPFGIAPHTFDEAWRFANFLAESALVPKDFRGKPGDVLVALQLGAEVGLPPMQSMQSIAVINGRPSIWGDGFLALLVASKVYRDHDEYYEVGVEQTALEVRDPARGPEEVRKRVLVRCAGLTTEDLKQSDTAAVCTFYRRDREAPITRRFTIGQARQAHLIGKEGPWSTYPDRMLAMRARSWAGRDAFPDVLRGLVAAEEARDLDTVDAEYRVAPQRASATLPASAAALSTVEAPPTELADSRPATPHGAPTKDRTSPPAAVTMPPARGLRITHTEYVTPADGEPYYRISAEGASGTWVFETFDAGTFKEAQSFEGTDHQVVITWEPTKTAQRIAKRICTLAIDEAPVGPSLFTS